MVNFWGFRQIISTIATAFFMWKCATSVITKKAWGGIRMDDHWPHGWNVLINTAHQIYWFVIFRNNFAIGWGSRALVLDRPIGFVVWKKVFQNLVNHHVPCKHVKLIDSSSFSSWTHTFGGHLLIGPILAYPSPHLTITHNFNSPPNIMGYCYIKP